MHAFTFNLISPHGFLSHTTHTQTHNSCTNFQLAPSYNSQRHIQMQGCLINNHGETLLDNKDPRQNTSFRAFLLCARSDLKQRLSQHRWLVIQAAPFPPEGALPPVPYRAPPSSADPNMPLLSGPQPCAFAPSCELSYCPPMGDIPLVGLRRRTGRNIRRRSLRRT